MSKNGYDDQVPIQPPFAAIAEVELNEEFVRISIIDPRASTIELFKSLDDNPRRELARQAGLLAIDILSSGQSVANERAIAAQIDAFKSAMDDRRTHLEKVFSDAHEKLLGEGGIPNAGEAVVKEIRTTFEEFLDDEDGQISSIIDGLPEQIKQALTSALDPLEPNSPANRLLNQLGTALDESTNLAKDLGDIFDPNNPKSAISELYRQLNPAIEGSPMNAVKADLMAKIEDSGKRSDEQNREMRDKMSQMESKMDTILAIQQHRRDNPNAIADGHDFESTVLTMVENVISTEAVEVRRTGLTVGSIPNCKKGDGVITFRPEHILAGRKVAIEVKHHKSYSSDDAFEELEKVRENREADVGIFVLSENRAPAGMPRLSVKERDILLVLDVENPLSEPYLHASLILAMAKANPGAEVDPEQRSAIADLTGRLEQEMRRYETISKAAGTIVRKGESIMDEARKGIKKLGIAVENTRQVMQSLGVDDVRSDTMEFD